MRNLPVLSTIFFQQYENCRRQESRSYGKVDGNWKLTFSPVQFQFALTKFCSCSLGLYRSELYCQR